MQEPDEIFDLVDEADRVVGQARRREVHADQLRHRAVHVFVFNELADLFIQKRSQNKDSFPGRYDSSASGHVHCGENYDSSALRELEEELSLAVRPERLQKHFKIEACSQTSWEFVWVYSLQTSKRPRINTEEIESGAFRSRGQLRADIEGRPDDFAPSFVSVYQEFDRRGLWPRA